MLKTLVFLAMLWGSMVNASEPSFPSRQSAVTPPQNASTDTQGNSTVGKTPTASFPTIIKIIPSSPLQIESSDKEEQRHGYTSAEWWLVYITGFLAIVTGVLAIFTSRLWGATERLVTSTDDASRRIERAYISASAISPGISFSDIPAAAKIYTGYNVTGALSVQVVIKNSGNTPARIIDNLINIMILKDGMPIPEKPIYTLDDPHQPLMAFIVKEDKIFLSKTTAVSEAQSTFDDIKSGKAKIVVFGYIDYMDIFDQQNRLGFGWIYEPSLDNLYRYGPSEDFTKRNNLLFLTEGEYSYDVKRYG